MTNLCLKCKTQKDEKEIIILNCNHIFCWKCIEAYLKKNLNNKIKCPSCSMYLRDCEVRKILPDYMIPKYETICRTKLPNSHLCVLVECGAVRVYSDVNTQYNCENCGVFNCVLCNKAHVGLTCGKLTLPDGTSLAMVCKMEMDRAKIKLQKNISQLSRDTIKEYNSLQLVPNSEIFTCELCAMDIGKHEGTTLRECLHLICKPCLIAYIRNSASIPMSCPFAPCQGMLEDRECYGILSNQDQAVYENKSISFGTRSLVKKNHCRQFNCDYLCELDDAAHSWTCPLCKSVNCVDCNVVHIDETCKEYTNRGQVQTKDNQNIEDQIKRKELMRCLECQTLLKKKSGCNWISCSNCGLELCWINQMHRSGPNGPGDTSGGCKCGIGGKKCHIDCKSGCTAERLRRHPRYLTTGSARAPSTSRPSLSSTVASVPDNNSGSRCVLS